MGAALSSQGANKRIPSPPSDAILMPTASLVRTFKASFRVIPLRKWSKKALSNGLDLLNLLRVQSEMEVDLEIKKDLTGAFKTAHPGRISSATADIPACFQQIICIKQAQWAPGLNPPRDIPRLWTD